MNDSVPAYATRGLYKQLSSRIYNTITDTYVALYPRDANDNRPHRSMNDASEGCNAIAAGHLVFTCERIVALELAAPESISWTQNAGR